MSFSVTIPTTGDYYLVLDNRASAEPRKVRLKVRASSGSHGRDDRHPVSAQRARNILRWADDPTLVRKWQPVFVPHMQTAVLRRLLASPPAWADRELIAGELAGRR